MANCKKAHFRTRRLAKQAAKTSGRSHGKKFRAYRCPACNLWHLTTVGQRRPRDIYELVVWCLKDILNPRTQVRERAA